MRKIAVILISFALLSCGEHQNNKDFKPIVLGDSSTIVTESDPQYLHNNVIDIEQRFNPQAEEIKTTDTATKVEENTTAQTPATNDNEPAGNEPATTVTGFTLKIASNTSIVFTEIDAKELKQQDAIKEHSLSYLQTKGDILLSKIILNGATDITIQQRYQSKVTIVNKGETLELSSLGKHTSDWKSIKVKQNSTEVLSKTNINNPQYPHLNQAKIKAAVDKTLKGRKSKAEINKWQTAVNRVKSAGDAPCEIKIDNVQWIVKGKDKSGAPFQKNIRLDLK